MTESGRDGPTVCTGRYRVLSACTSVLGFVLIVVLLMPLASRDVVKFDLPEWGPAAMTAATLSVFVVAMVLAWIPHRSAGVRVLATVGIAFAGIFGSRRNGDPRPRGSIGHGFKSRPPYPLSP
jgi:hypothetical protein